MTADRRARLAAATRASTFQLLLRCARRVDERATARIDATAGRRGFRKAHANLLPHLSFDGIRISDLAERVGVTKQAVSKVVAEMAAERVVEVVPDPTDARARLVRFTPRGVDAIAHRLGVLAGLERGLTRSVGVRRMKQLREALVALDDALDLSSPDAAR